MRWIGGLLMLVGLAPLIAALGAESLSHLLIGCTANEAGATGCVIWGRDISPWLMHGFDGLGLIPWGLPVAFVGAALALWGWGQDRAASRRARHR